METVTIKPEWQDDGDEGLTFEVKKDNGERLIIAPVEYFGDIQPTMLISDYMIERN